MRDTKSDKNAFQSNQSSYQIKIVKIETVSFVMKDGKIYKNQ